MAAASLIVASPARASHDRAFWEDIVAREYAVPEGESAIALALELADLAGSPDPVLRDTLAYEITTTWVYRQRLFSPEELGRLVARYEAGLAAGLGESGTDSVLGRSFSALNLATLVALDNEAPFFDADAFGTLLDAALGSLEGERDLRGYDERLGWAHSAAHAADLLKFLARSRHLRAADQRRILDAIGGKLAAPTGWTFIWGEDERLARAVVAIVAREDFDGTSFAAWTAALPDVSQGLWDTPTRIDPARFAATQNTKALLRSLFAILSGNDGPTPAQQAARTEVLRALARF